MWKTLRPVGAVERAVLDGFAEVFGRESRSAFQIGDGARSFQDAVMGARGNAEALDGRFQDFFAFGGIQLLNGPRRPVSGDSQRKAPIGIVMTQRE